MYDGICYIAYPDLATLNDVELLVSGKKVFDLPCMTDHVHVESALTGRQSELKQCWSRPAIRVDSQEFIFRNVPTLARGDQTGILVDQPNKPVELSGQRAKKLNSRARAQKRA